MSTYSKDPEKLNPRHAKLVEERMKGKTVEDAAQAAGISRTHGSRILNNSPAAKKAMETAQKAVQAKINYGLETAMNEAKDAIEFAKRTDNANAYVKAVELRSKLNGLLVEKHDVRQVGFSLVIQRGGTKKAQEAEEEEEQEVIEADFDVFS